MKETKKLRCFSKMKRIVLTLFAAFCVGSVWGGTCSVSIADFAIGEDGTMTFKYTLKYSQSGTSRKPIFKIFYGKMGETPREATVFSSTSGYTASNKTTTIKNNEVYTLQNCGMTADDYRVVFDFVMDGSSSDYHTDTMLVNDAACLIESASCSWNNKPTIQYVIEGSLKSDRLTDVKAIKVKYQLNVNEFTSDAVIDDVTINNGAFQYAVNTSSMFDTILWSVIGVDKNDNERVFTDTKENVSNVKTLRKEYPYLTYTWTGLGENNLWNNLYNWDCDGTGSAFGYPGLNSSNTSGIHTTDSYTLCGIRFVGNAEIDLGGKTYEFYEQDDGSSGKNKPFRGLYFEKPSDLETMNVVLKNGTLGTRTPSGKGPHFLGASGVELEFNNATFKVRGDSNYLVPNANSTIVFSGNRDHDWYFSPYSSYSQNFNLIFKDFTGITYYNRDLSVPNGSVVRIINSLWKVRVGTSSSHTAGKGFAKRVVFRDGQDRQAIMRVCYLSSGEDYYANINLNNTYDIKIPAAGHEDASIWARDLTAEPTATFEIEVTDYLKGDRVPLINLSKSQGPTYKTLPTLVAKANDQDVTTARNARLFWDGKILYYQQNTQNAAEVGGVEYATFADAFGAAEDGATVKLLNDVTLTEKLTVKKAVTLDLNGCTLSETVTPAADEFDYGAFYIGTAGNLTITDSATGGRIATNGDLVIGNYGTVTVNGGTIEAGEDADNDASIYNFYHNGSTYGKATINGGSIGRIWNCGTANITAGTVGDIDNSGAMTIAEEAVIEDEEIILGNDAADVPNAGTIVTSKELSVKTLVDDYTVENVDGVYKLKYSKTYTVTLPTAPANTVWYCNGQEVTGPVYAEYGSNVTITLKPAEGCSFSDGAVELTVIEISAIGADTEVTLDNVTVPEAFQVVAKIGDTPYASLQAAYAAAEAESTIVLCKDVTGAGLVIDKSLTIDFGGKTYTFNDGVGNIPSNGFQILDGNTITLKNGELNVDAGSADKFYTLIQNYANLTVEDMVLDGTNLDKWSKTDGNSYVLSNNSGTVVVAGATSIIANDEGALAYAFDVCKYKTYAIPTVTLNTTGTIAGKVEVSGGDFVYEAGTIEDAIVFTSGTVKGNVEDALTIPEDKKLVLNEAGAYVLADKIVVAKVGDNLFETIAEAFAAAQAGDTVILEKSLAVNEVLQIPANVTLDLNGNELQALAVVGKLSMNGGALKTWDANTQTYFFMAAPAGALYQTSDAVMTIGADYALSLDGGSVTLPASWRTLLGQSLTIKSGATFVIPTGVQLNLRGNAVVEDGATLTCEGTIALGNTYDAVDTSATLTSAQLAEGTVVSAVEGYRPVYANGVYSLEEIPAEFAAQVGETKYATLAAALADEANLSATIELIANTKENITIPAEFAGTIDLGGYMLKGYVKYTGNGAATSVMTLTNGSIYNETTTSAVTVKAAKVNMINLNVYTCKYHGVRVENGGEVVINGGKYELWNNSTSGLTLLYARGEGSASTASTAKITVIDGTFIAKIHPANTNRERYIVNINGPGREIYIQGGVFEADNSATYNVSTHTDANGVKAIFSITGGEFSHNPETYVATGYKVEGTGPWTVVKSWTAPLPDLEEGDSFSGEYEYTPEVLSALETKAATSVDVKVNGVELKGDEAIKALNTAVASFGDALTFNGTAASVDIVIEVTEVNTAEPAASTVVVKRGTEELTVKVTPTVKYFYPETKTWGTDKPESGAVLFKLVFEAK